MFHLTWVVAVLAAVLSLTCMKRDLCILAIDSTSSAMQDWPVLKLPTALLDNKINCTLPNLSLIDNCQVSRVCFLSNLWFSFVSNASRIWKPGLARSSRSPISGFNDIVDFIRIMSTSLQALFTNVWKPIEPKGCLSLKRVNIWVLMTCRGKQRDNAVH